MPSKKPLPQRSVEELRCTLIRLKAEMLALLEESDLVLLELLKRSEDEALISEFVVRHRCDLN